MTAVNGHASKRANGRNDSPSAPVMFRTATQPPLTPERIKELVRELEVPFDLY